MSTKTSQEDGLTHEQRRAPRPAGAGTLRRSSDRVIAGVAGGVAKTIGVAPARVRIGFVLLGVISGGIFVIVYALLAVLLPKPRTQ